MGMVASGAPTCLRCASWVSDSVWIACIAFVKGANMGAVEK